MAVEKIFLIKFEDNFEKLLTLHFYDSEQFIEEQSEAIKTWEDAWRELVYCILAGTQVSNNIVKKSFFNLIEYYPELFEFPVNKQKINVGRISRILKSSGYRFYKTKAQAIQNAHEYFDKIVADYSDISFLDWYDVRLRLIKNVKGIGNKIASHWLRNIGFNVPIIDVHVRRVLGCAGLIDRKYSKYQITDMEYWRLEKKVIEIANRYNISVSKLDYILWKHGREFCIHNMCSLCPLSF